MQDYGYTFTNARRRSNSSTQGLNDFKTKFETVEPEPVFEEELHGAPPEMANENGDTKSKDRGSSESSVSASISGRSEDDADIKGV